jgi:hypothetical protein
MKVACVKNNLEDPLKRGLWPPGQVFAAGIKSLNVRSVGETPARRREPLRCYFADGGKLRFRSCVRKAFAMMPAMVAGFVSAAPARSIARRGYRWREADLGRLRSAEVFQSAGGKLILQKSGEAR